jgi:tRNA nucleotidyltransferase (CCA-adding enzyme)
MRTTLIVTHVSADFDAAASAYGASLLYEGSRAVLPGSPNRNVREFLTLHSDIFRFYSEKEIDFSKIGRIVLTDIQSLDRTGVMHERLRALDVPTIIYDHHPPAEDTAPSSEIHVEQVGSTTTLIVEEIQKREIALSPAEATFLALGIHEDTGSLTFTSTTVRDVKALSYLYEKGARTDVIFKFLHSTFTSEQTQLLKMFLDNLEIINIHGAKVLFSHARANQFVDGASTVVHRISDMFAADLVAMVLLQNDRSVIICRSSVSEINCLELLSPYDPGGHPEACVAYTNEKRIGKIKDRIFKYFSSHIRQSPRVRDVMTPFVVSITPDMKVSEVKKLFLTTGHGGFPVIEEGRLVGIITRSEIEKAEIHRLEHAPVKGFMIRDVITIGAEEPIDRAVEIMMAEGIGRLPVVEDGRLVGIITRTDILKTMKGEEYYAKERKKAKEIAIARFEQNLPDEVKSVIRLAGFIAEELHQKAYLVGGIVRDLLLGHENLDIDIVIEGSAIDVAAKLANTLGAKIDAYERFNTAVVMLPSGLRVDFATARTEFYERPGALPVVTISSIKSDLVRRDFTVNSLAMSLSRKDFGEIIDVTGGISDLFEGKIRVMHSLSFIEDPTRIIRAVRFEVKFGFKMDSSTEALCREAINMGMIRKAIGVRMRDEIFDLSYEENFFEGLRRLEELGALAELFERERIGDKSWMRLKNIKKKKLENKQLKKIAVLGSILAGLDDEKRKKIYRDYRLNASDFRLIEQLVELLKNEDMNLTTRSEIYFHFKKYDERAVRCLLYILNENSPLYLCADLYLSELINIKPPLSGRDIIKLGIPESPDVGRIKNFLLKAYLDGEIRTTEEAKQLIDNLKERR